MEFRTTFYEVLVHFATTYGFFGMLVSRSRFLWITGSESGRLGFQNQAFGNRGLAKNNLSYMARFGMDSVDSGVVFSCVVLCSLGTNLNDFGCCGDRFENW